ncbi:MAG: hypothetical protein COV44_05780 [Deltaproteobacteria bacterium CG11_big_fil_rev_8_21_14_0_20_45_16]|nr:MAG: hypothetical protein COV44_05780 [Deltaproteobacteria bacterium CG11_big_fil_rev_8_21_14_0_20_45_16]
MHWINEQSSIGIACFVKTPGLSPIKTRLASSIGNKNALKVYELMLAGLRGTFESLLKLDPNATAYWAVAEEELDNSYWSDFPCLKQDPGDLGDRLHSIYSQILERHDGAILIGADCPLLTSHKLYSAGQKLRSQQAFVLGPTLDGGFYLFGGARSLEKEVWKRPPYSAATTKCELQRELSKIQTVVELEELSDVDEYEDLLELLKAGKERQENVFELLNFVRSLITQHLNGGIDHLEPSDQFM